MEERDSTIADISTKRDVKAGDVYKLLMQKFSDERQWLCAGEVSDATGGGNRRLDFVAVNCYESNGYGIHAFEIKISKSDLRRELEDPTKHNIFFDWVDTYSICAPDYVLDAEYKSMIPPKWGIYTLSTRVVNDENSGEPRDERYLKTVRKPLNFHDDKEVGIKRSFAMALLRSIRNQNAQRFYLEDLLKQEYERGRQDAVCGKEYELNRYKRMYSDDEWKIRYVDKLRLYTKEKADQSLAKIQAMITLYDEMDWLKNRIDSLVTATGMVKKLSEDFRKAMEGSPGDDDPLGQHSKAPGSPSPSPTLFDIKSECKQ